MAILERPKEAPLSGVIIQETAPAGTFLAVCVDVEDMFGVERHKYQSQDMEVVNLTRFTFGFKAKDGKKYVVRTRKELISGNEKANLVKFLKAWKGKVPYGVDYNTFVGDGAQVTVENFVGKRGDTLALVAGIAPVLDGLEDKVPKAAEFAEFFAGGRGDTTAPESSHNETEEEPPF